MNHLSTGIIFWLLVPIALSGCSSPETASKPSRQQVRFTVQNALSNQVFIKGGTFMLGDIGTEDGRLYNAWRENNKPPVEVTLDSYSIARYETTWAEFLVYLKDVGRADDYTLEAGYLGANLLPITSNQDPLSPNYYLKPARSPNYAEAEGFCQWLGEQSGQPFSLPTEAQWEYAARSRGKRTPYATNTGKVQMDPYLARPKEYVDPSIAPSGNALIQSSIKKERRPVGTYPPNPIGLYDMTGNVAEWTRDWYQPDYYKIAPRKNPSGPDKPFDPEAPRKTVRDWAGHGGHMGGEGTVFVRGGEAVDSSANGFRCVVNSVNERVR